MKKHILISFLCFFLSVSFVCAQSYNIGQTVEVKWNGYWHQAAISNINNGLYYIHYSGWASSYDEWVNAIRIRNGQYSIGDNVSVLWKGAYYNAKIISKSNSLFKIHYIGYDSKWDEWVQCNRIRKNN